MNGSATVTDATGRFTGSVAQVAADAVAALNAWGSWLVSGVGSVEIEIRIVESSATAYASGSAGGLFFTGIAAGVRIAESGAAIELRTGFDPNGATADIRVNLNVDALIGSGSMWINPLTGVAPPFGKVDLVSILAHEIGHGLGITGLRDEATYVLTNASQQSAFDSYVTLVGGQPYFNGPNAMALYGGPVPLTQGNLYHVGNPSGPGADLRSDLMYAQAHTGTTPVSALDGRLLSDLGLATVFSDRLVGLAGADTIGAGEGDDYVRGGDGDDSISGGPGFDDINGNAGADSISGGFGPDWVVGGKQNDVLTGDDGADVVLGNLGDDLAEGGPGDDLIRGGQDNDRLSGGPGADWLSGDRGSDTLTGGSGADVFHSFAEAGVDLVTDFSLAEGDRVQLDAGLSYSVRQAGPDTVIDIVGGAQVILAGASSASLVGGWIFSA